MTTAYAGDHTSALADVAAAGTSVTFTLTSQGSYNPATDVTTPASDVVVSGYAIETKGSLFKYQTLELVAQNTRTLFFVPTTLGLVPPLNSRVTWNGATYAVKYVEPIAPDGTVLAARVLVSL